MLHRLLVICLRRSDEVIVRNIHQAQQVSKALRHLIAKRLRIHPRIFGRRLDFLSVLVRAAEKKNGSAGKAHVTRDDIAREGCVGMSDVGFVVDVIDGGGDFEGRAAVVERGGGGADERCRGFCRGE